MSGGPEHYNEAMNQGKQCRTNHRSRFQLLSAMAIPPIETPFMEKEAKVALFPGLTVRTNNHVAVHSKGVLFSRGEPGEVGSKPAGLVPRGRCEDGKPIGRGRKLMHPPMPIFQD